MVLRSVLSDDLEVTKLPKNKEAALFRAASSK
jgi:hypothetical protein